MLILGQLKWMTGSYIWALEVTPNFTGPGIYPMRQFQAGKNPAWFNLQVVYNYCGFALKYIILIVHELGINLVFIRNLFVFSCDLTTLFLHWPRACAVTSPRASRVGVVGKRRTLTVSARFVALVSHFQRFEAHINQFFLPISTDLLCLQHAQMPRTRDLAIFVTYVKTDYWERMGLIKIVWGTGTKVIARVILEVGEIKFGKALVYMWGCTLEKRVQWCLIYCTHPTTMLEGWPMRLGHNFIGTTRDPTKVKVHHFPS